MWQVQGKQNLKKADDMEMCAHKASRKRLGLFTGPQAGEDSVVCRRWKPECSGFEYRTEIAEMEFPLKTFGCEEEERIKERAGMKASIPEWQEGQCSH